MGTSTRDRHGHLKDISRREDPWKEIETNRDPWKEKVRNIMNPTEPMRAEYRMEDDPWRSKSGARDDARRVEGASQNIIGRDLDLRASDTAYRQSEQYGSSQQRISHPRTPMFEPPRAQPVPNPYDEPRRKELPPPGFGAPRSSSSFSDELRAREPQMSVLDRPARPDPYVSYPSKYSYESANRYESVSYPATSYPPPGNHLRKY